MEFPSRSASPLWGDCRSCAVWESKVGGGYDRDVTLRIVINCAYDETEFEKDQNSVSTGQGRAKRKWDGTYPPTPGTEILQRVSDDLHAVAEHTVQIEFLVLVYHCW